jgi:ABC-type nitrate/sulfonate/bicarbonate transport system substrate-binding protein
MEEEHMEKKFGKISRRTFLEGALAGGSLLATSGIPVFAQSPTKLIFMEPFDLALEYIHEMNAVVGGHFEKEGLDVEINNARGTAVGIQQVIAGQATTTRIGLLDLLKASGAQDTRLLSVATSLQGGIFSLISRKADPIMTPADLRGKTVGVASMGGGQENILNLLLASANIPVADVPRQAIGSNAGNVEVLKAGRVDAFLATVETSLLLQTQGEPIEVWSTSKYAPLPGGVIVTTAQFAKDNHETVVKFVRAMRNSALEIIDSDPAPILDRVVAKFDIVANESRDFRLKAIKAYNELTLEQGRENVMRNVPSVFEAAAKLVGSAGIAKIDDVTSLYSNDFLDEATK